MTRPDAHGADDRRRGADAISTADLAAAIGSAAVAISLAGIRARVSAGILVGDTGPFEAVTYSDTGARLSRVIPWYLIVAELVR